MARYRGEAMSFVAVRMLPRPAGGGGLVPDPTLLPVSTTSLVQDDTAYNALNVSSQSAGFSYTDPVTSVKVWKITDATFGAGNTSCGHDYANGPWQISRAWGPLKKHTIVVGVWVGSGGVGTGTLTYYLVDFQRGVGFSNTRALTTHPRRDLCAGFSGIVGQEQILYIHDGTNLQRYDTAAMALANTGNFPLAQGAYAWLQHDITDTWFCFLDTDNLKVWYWNSQTNLSYSHSETWANEPYMESDGQYVVYTSGGAFTTTEVIDLTTTPPTVGAAQSNPPFVAHISHACSCRKYTVAIDPNGFQEQRYDQTAQQFNTGVNIVDGHGGDDPHSSAWYQDDAYLAAHGGNGLLSQWVYTTPLISSADTTYWANCIWKGAIGLQRVDGSDQRTLCHAYNLPVHAYFDSPWGHPSIDGRVAMFNSKQNQAATARWDLFVAEVPLR